jgi:hypothetical protein
MGPPVTGAISIGLVIGAVNMSPMHMTVEEIKRKGFAVLMKEQGPVGYVCFMQQFGERKGDYTKNRGKWIDEVDFSKIDMKFGQGRNGKNKSSSTATSGGSRRGG